MILYSSSHLIFSIFFLLVLLTISLSIQIGYSQNPAAFNGTSLQIPGPIKGTYSLPEIGFNITFPKGWSGLNHGFIAMVSPDGINQYNGNLRGDQNKTLMVIEFLNLSDFQQDRNSYEMQNNCRIVSEKYLTLNDIQTKEVSLKCGVGSVEKIINYIFGSGNKIIIVGLKGIGTPFDNDLDDFMNSVRTVTIKNPIELKQMANSLH